MMFKLLIYVIWFDTSSFTCSVCLIWEIYVQKKMLHGLKSFISILPKPYVDIN
jgi:hypothetical protein